MRLGSVQGEQQRVGIRLKTRKQDVVIGSVPGVPRPLAGAYMTEVEAEPGSPVVAMPEPGALRPVGTPG